MSSLFAIQINTKQKQDNKSTKYTNDKITWTEKYDLWLNSRNKILYKQMIKISSV